MSYTPPGVNIQQGSTPAPGATNVTNPRVIGVLADFPQGPDTPYDVDFANAAAIFGDASNPLYSGFRGPSLMRAITQQVVSAKAYDVVVRGLRVGVTRAQALVLDGAGLTSFIIQPVGQYAGSAGNNVSVVVNAPQIVVSELLHGSSSVNEIQQITIYKASSATGTFTLSLNGNAGTAISMSGISATTVQAGINAISPSPGVLVSVGSSPLAGAITFVVVWGGFGAAPLLTVSSNAITGGTGLVPVGSISIMNGSNLLQQITSGQYDLSTPTKIVQAINAVNSNVTSLNIVSAKLPTGSPGAIPASGTVTAAGGSDGMGALYSDATIAPLLAQVSSGTFGQMDFLVTGYDAALILPQVATAISAGLPNNVFIKALLGPVSGTTQATLLAGYQQAASDRILFMGQDSVSGQNATNRTSLGPLDGYTIAAMIASRKAQYSAEKNLTRERLTGVGNMPPIPPDLGRPQTPAELTALASLGYTVLQYSPRLKALIIRDLLTTAPNTDQYGRKNHFMYLAERDAFDMIALTLLDGLEPFIGDPSIPVTAIAPQYQAYASVLMAGMNGRYHNGATATVTFDAVNLIINIAIGYADRPPLNTINVVLTPVY